MDQQNNSGRSFSIFIDHPLFCLVSLLVIGSTITKCIGEIMQPFNRMAEAAAKKKEND